MDPPDVIVKTALELHVKMIREFSGVPGVKPERLAEGLQPRHCALSLVGEPIMVRFARRLRVLVSPRRDAACARALRHLRCWGVQLRSACAALFERC